uniref:Uncharacterized protein n=1 Tax=Spumella elongata TaxID=89044 RepID=A0A7S3M0J5_9STRA
MWYWDKDDKKTKPELLEKKTAQKLNIKKATAIFDGNFAHCVEKFDGERISVVFFSARNHNKVGPANIKWLKSHCGFAWPSDKAMAKLRTFAHGQFLATQR